MKALKNLPKALAILGLITFGMSFTTTSAQGASSTAGFLEGFNERGIVMTSISSGDDEARGIALQADEKFVVAGYTSNGTDKDFAVARYNPDGSLDTSFGPAGIVVTHVSSENDEINDVAVQADGKIVVVGSTTLFGPTSFQFAMARYNSDGSLDTAFGSAGIVLTSFSNNHDRAYAVVIQPDGKIVASGTADFGQPSDFAVARYNTDGSLDSTFGGDGKVTTAVFDDYELAFGDVLLQPDGKIILTGDIQVGPPYSGKPHFGMVRYNTDGSIDTTFGSAGHVVTDFGYAENYGMGAVLQPDGKTVMTGSLSYYDNEWKLDIGVSRYHTDGSLDPTFGVDGKVTTDFDNAYENPQGIALQADGKVVVTGFSDNDFFVVRYNTDGNLDTAFGNGGRVLTDFSGGFDAGLDIAVQSDGVIIAVGFGHNGRDRDFALVCLNTDGSTCSSNLSPSADAGGPYNADEGSPIIFDASNSSDPNGDILQYCWDFNNDGIWDTDCSESPIAYNTWGDDWTGNVSVTVSDGELTTTAITSVTVTNVAPAVGEITVPVDPFRINTEINASSTFTDPGTNETHTATWAWGDGLTSEGVVTDHTVIGKHTYAAPGVYTLALTVEDDDGGVDTATYQYVVVYDPEGGFVTGGGWVWSPEGAYTSDPSLTGRAIFGFVSKYQKGANIPIGNTEFQFAIADLNFKSTSYDWLVIVGSKAKYKGSGTINGIGEYGFMLSALDGMPDRFRIKIWEKATGVVVYDNQFGAADDVDPLTAIEGGSVVVHKAK